uniref:BTB domain-containing protein n=3 Tax=Parascaris univalens TaxID=6257 RepID=A0A914ZRP5_PARUN
MAMTHTTSCPSSADFSQGGQSLPPIHEALMPLRQTRPLPSLCDALSTASEGQQQQSRQQSSLMCNAASSQSPVAPSPNNANSTHDSHTASSSPLPVATTSSFNCHRLSDPSPTPQHGVLSSDGTPKKITTSQTSGAVAEGSAQQVYVHNHQSSHLDYAPINRCQQLQQPRVQSMQVASSAAIGTAAVAQQPLMEQRILHPQQLQPTYRYVTVKTEPSGRSSFALPTSQSTTFPGDDYQPRMNASSDSSNVTHPASQRVTYLVNSVSTSAGGATNSMINAHMQRTYTDTSNNSLQGTQTVGASSGNIANRSYIINNNTRQPSSTDTPSTQQIRCTPTRTLYRSASASGRKANGRSSTKKEPMDAKNVEEEVARNVSQILSASLNQKSATANSSNPISSGLSLNSALKSSNASSLTSNADSMGLSGSNLPSSCSLSTPSTRKYVCVDCQKSVSSPRNLQRHRTSCKSVIASNASRSNEVHTLNSLPVSSANQLPSEALAYRSAQCATGGYSVGAHNATPNTSAATTSLSSYAIHVPRDCIPQTTVSSLSAMSTVSSAVGLPDSDDRLGPECEDSFLESAVAELAQNDDLSMITPGSLASGLLDDDHSLPPLALNEDGLDIGSVSASEQASFSNSATTSISDSTASQIRAASSVDVAALYQCESCNKRVSSSRSLKRHRSTCKLYQLDFGHLLQQQAVPQTAHNAGNDSACVSSPGSLGVAARQGVGAGATLAVNVCEHCNRSLCSASNLKRHRATCKAANARVASPKSLDSMQSALANSASLTTTPQTYENVEVDERERSILDRSYAAALAASRQSVASSLTSTTRRRAASGGNACATSYSAVAVGAIPHQHTVVPTSGDDATTTLKLGMMANKPWITVGEHLRAQHNQRIIQQRQQQQLLEQQQRAAMQNACAAQSTGTTQAPGAIVVQGGSSSGGPAPQRNTATGASFQRGVMQQQGSSFATATQFETSNAAQTVSCETNANSLYVAAPPDLSTSTPVGGHMADTEYRQPAHDDPSIQVGCADEATLQCVTGSETTTLLDNCADSGKFSSRPLDMGVSEEDRKPVLKESETPKYSSNKSISGACFSITSTVAAPMSQCVRNETRPLVSIITTAPLTGKCTSDPLPQQTSNVAAFATPVVNGNPSGSYLDPLDYRFECPECQKTYSCRKNVKRHRMAVHKLSPEDVAKTEPIRVLLSSEEPQKRQMSVLKVDEKDSQGQMQSVSAKVDSSATSSMCAVGSADGASIGIATSTQQQPPPVMCSSTAPVSPGGPISVGDTWSAICVPTSGSGEPIASYQFTEDDGAQLAKIEEDLRRSAEFKLANFTEPDSESETKKPVAELAEADTTFNEDYDDPNCRISSSHPPSITSTGGMVSPSSGPSSNSSTCSSYPITSSNNFSHMTMAPPAPAASGFVAHLLPIKTSVAVPPPPLVTHSQQQTPLHIDTHIAGSSAPVVGRAVNLPPPQYVQQSSQQQPALRTYVQPHVVVKQKQPHVCADCNRTLSSDYSLKRHRSTCVEVKAAAAAAAKAANEAAKHAPQFLQESSTNLSTTYLVSSDPMMSQQLQPKSVAYAATDANARMARQLAPLNNRASDMIIAQTTFSAFDDDTDSGVLCRVCDCWLPGQREFERHCDELHPVAADPDSTTVANSHDSSVTPPSAFLLNSQNSDIGSQSSAPYSPTGSRKRVGYDSTEDLSSQCGKSSKHLCQACGKFYSSEWNLERHKRESCPLRSKRSKSGDEKGQSRLTRLDSLDLTPLQPVDPKWIDDCALVVGDSRIGVSRSVMSRSSTYFASLFQYYDSHSDVPLPVPVDPLAFQQAVEVFKGTLPLDEKNIDCVIYMADKFKLKPLYEQCESFVAEKLPSSSVMHAIRLAEQYRMCEIKQALFDSISIDVFRSLAADEDYRQMGAELKAELLE